MLEHIMINIGIIQFEPRIFDVDGNLSRLEDHIQQAASESAQLIVLPEMFNAGFTTQEELMTVAEPMDGRTVSWMQEQAIKHNTILTGSIYEHYQGHFYNTMVLITPDRNRQHYRKRNPTGPEALAYLTPRLGGLAESSALIRSPAKRLLTCVTTRSVWSSLLLAGATL
jgi:predicted amidohydrolase